MAPGGPQGPPSSPGSGPPGGPRDVRQTIFDVFLYKKSKGSNKPQLIRRHFGSSNEACRRSAPSAMSCQGCGNPMCDGRWCCGHTNPELLAAAAGRQAATAAPASTELLAAAAGRQAATAAPLQYPHRCHPRRQHHYQHRCHPMHPRRQHHYQQRCHPMHPRALQQLGSMRSTTQRR